MRSMIAAAGVMILLGACAPEPVEPDVPVADEAELSAGAAARPSTQAQAGCDARNGEMRRVGMLGSWQCIVRYADAGERCTDGDQCEGECRAGANPPPPPGPGEPVATPAPPPPSATEGVCQADSNQFGCYAVVEDGRAQPMNCVD